MRVFVVILVFVSHTAFCDSMLDSLRVPDGFVVDRVAGPPLTSYPMFMCFDERGRLFIAESSGLDLSGQEMIEQPGCTILRLEDIDDDGIYDRRSVFSDQLTLPMGVLWHEGALYAASPPELLRFTDADDDGVADTREVLLSGWNMKNTASLHGPYLGPDGFLYLTHGRHGYRITSKEGTVFEGEAARIWRCRPDGTGLERYCGGGFDNPIEIVFTPPGELIGTMTYFTDPKNGQRDALNHWVEGGVYPKPHPSTAEFIQTGPLLPSITHFSRIAPSGLVRMSEHGLGGMFAGDLFSAQFNPSRVQLHRLHRSGASFVSDDSDFLTSDNPHFHPTDVLEDIDGSLLVSDTGGWYVDACPISRVARPEYKGGIYRVRRASHERAPDAWKVLEAHAHRSGEDLLHLMADPRALVQEYAREALAARLEQAAPDERRALVGAAAKIMRDPHVSSAQRTAMMWAVARAGAKEAEATLCDLMRDAEEEVRIAAAAVLGTVRTEAAAIALTEALKDSSAAVRREAARSLGASGARGLSAALLDSVQASDDSILRHSIVYALIQLEDHAALGAGLKSELLQRRTAAALALEALDGELIAADVTPLLGSEDAMLRGAGLWIASLHPEWAQEVLAFAGDLLNNGAGAAASARSVLDAYVGTDPAQQFLAERLQQEEVSDQALSMLLDVMGGADLNAFPQVWLDAVESMLASGQDRQRFAAIRLIRMRGLSAFDGALLGLMDDPQLSPELRLAALAALQPRSETVRERDLNLIRGLLEVEQAAHLRQSAADILRSAPLTESQREVLAETLLPKADALIFAAVLEAVTRGGGDKVGALTVGALEQNEAARKTLTARQLDAVLHNFSEDTRRSAAVLRAALTEAEAARIARLQALEPRLGHGDVGRGRAIFFSERAACFTCHAIGDEGGDLGPDLTTIGVIRSEMDLLEAVLFPSASQVPGYENLRVEIVDHELGGSDAQEGIIGGETADAIELKTGVGVTLHVPRADIISISPLTVSKMPENLDATISESELIDLITFLRSLNNEQWLLPAQLEVAAGIQP